MPSITQLMMHFLIVVSILSVVVGRRVISNSSAIELHAKGENHVRASASGGKICCCKRTDAGCDVKDADPTKVDLKDGEDKYAGYCCKLRSYIGKRGCDIVSTAYSKRISALSIYYDVDTCARIEVGPPKRQPTPGGGPQGQATLADRGRAAAFSCPRDLECGQPPPTPLPSDWSQKPWICRGVHNILGFVGPAVPQYLNVTQGVAITKGALALGGITKATEGLMGTLAEFAGPVAIAGATGGALVNMLKLMEKMCLVEWEFIDKCAVGVSVASVVLAVLGLVLTFTGIGVPVSAFLLGLSSFLVRRVGGIMCPGVGAVHRGFGSRLVGWCMGEGDDGDAFPDHYVCNGRTEAQCATLCRSIRSCSGFAYDDKGVCYPMLSEHEVGDPIPERCDSSLNGVNVVVTKSNGIATNGHRCFMKKGGLMKFLRDIKHHAGAALFAMKESFQNEVEELRKLRADQIPELALKAARNFFPLFWSILKNIGLAIAEGLKGIVTSVVNATSQLAGRNNAKERAQEQEAMELARKEERNRQLCCAVRSARTTFLEIGEDHLIDRFGDDNEDVIEAARLVESA